MSLDTAKLEKVRELAGGIVQARCPACAEGGGDRKGEHLRIYPDGRYRVLCPSEGWGAPEADFCPGGGEAQEAGDIHTAGEDAAGNAGGQVGEGGFGRLRSGTLGTPKTESENGVPGVPTSPAADFGTLGTGNSKLRARARERIHPTI